MSKTPYRIILYFLFLLNGVPLFAKDFILRMDNYTYVFRKESLHDGKASSIAVNFHDIFSAEAVRHYNAWNIKRPVDFRVILTENAAIFGKETGQNWHSASLYSFDSDTFYFQNPISLAKQKILHKSIRHELCHQSISVMKKNKDIIHRWLEESLCEYTSSEKYGLTADEKKQMMQISALRGLASFISANLKSGIKEKQNRAYRMGANFAGHTVEKMGISSVLKIASGEDIPENNPYLEKLFLDYRKNLFSGNLE